MLPMIRVFGYDIAMYGLMNLIGVIVAIFIAIKIGRISGMEKEDVIFASMYGVIGVVVGGKILYLLINIKALWNGREVLLHNPEVLKGILTGGFVFYGGLLGSILMIVRYCRRYHISIEKMLFTLIPVIPLIHAFGRIGCFMAGCCYGIPYSGIFHIMFHSSPVGPNGINLFPVQLVESFFNLLIFMVLVVLAVKKKSTLVMITVYGSCYSIVRFSLEFLRGDVERGRFLSFSTSQWISIAIFLMTLIIIVKNKKIFFKKYLHV